MCFTNQSLMWMILSLIYLNKFLSLISINKNMIKKRGFIKGCQPHLSSLWKLVTNKVNKYSIMIKKIRCVSNSSYVIYSFYIFSPHNFSYIFGNCKILFYIPIIYFR